MATQSRLTFWGCRGSIPTPGADTVVFGGNTSCVSIEHGQHLMVFDAGTGMRTLGQHLISRPDLASLQGHIFLSHTHWDHIQGLPFFTPAFQPELHFTIYGEQKGTQTLGDVLRAQMQTPYFPVAMETVFRASMRFEDIQPDRSLHVGTDITVMPFGLDHPGGSIGYRVQIGDVCIAYVTDHEHPVDNFAPEVLASVCDADVLIHDAQYSRAELRQGKQGWGHSAWEDVVDFARVARVRQLFLFHHDPTRTDEELGQRESLAKQRFPSTHVAREGLQVDLNPYVLLQTQAGPRMPSLDHSFRDAWDTVVA